MFDYVLYLWSVIAVILIYNLHQWMTKWKYFREFPGPKALPIIGNVHQLGTNPKEYLDNLLKYWRIYDCKLFRIWIGNHPYVLLTDPKDIEALLSSHTIIDKGDIYDLFDQWLGKGLLTSTGTKWFTHRKMITPSFHFKILLDFLDTINKNSNKFMMKLEEISKNGKCFDFQSVTHACTLDTICETAMGIEINAMDNGNSRLVEAFQEMCHVIQERAFSSWKRNSFLYPFSKCYRKEKEALEILKSFTMAVIANRAASINKTDKEETLNAPDDNDDDDGGIKRKKAFLDNLLTARIDGKPLKHQDIYEEVQTFMFEGHDTTTSGVTFCIYLLSRHPEIQTKIFNEQKNLFNHNFDTVPTYQDIQDMKYLELVIKESQRLYPSVPIFARCTRDNITLNGKFIPANTTLTIFGIAMGYNEKYFKDAKKFRPERFENREGANPYEYVPFSAGPRNCIGQKFAMMELKSIISNIVRNFEILPPNDECLKCCDSNIFGDEAATDYDPILQTVLTLKSVNGVQIRLQKRRE